jgi:hypothetical protein
MGTCKLKFGLQGAGVVVGGIVVPVVVVDVADVVVVVKTGL